MSGPRKSFYILLPLFSTLIALLLVESGLSFVYPIPFSLEINMYFEPDPYTGYRQRPLGRGYYPNGVEANANSRGHRDAEVQIPKPAGVSRVLMLGDSFTVGANVELDEAYPQVLEELLNESGEGRVEVINAGVGGWSPFQYAQYYEYYGDQFEPDLILIGLFVGNDLYIDRFSVDETLTAVLGRRISRQTGTGLWTKIRILLYENSHIARALMNKGVSKTDFSRDDCADFDDYFVAVQAGRMSNHAASPSPQDLEYMQRNVAELQRIRDRAAAKAIPVVTVIFPDENQLNQHLQAAIVRPDERDRYDYSMPQAKLRTLLDERNMAQLDLLELFAKDNRCLFMNDTHWVPAGHRIVAEQLHDYIRGNNLL